MANGNGSSADPLVTLSNALALVFDGIALAEKGLLKNPSKEEERQLNINLAQLERDRATIKANILALSSKSREIAPPTEAQVAEMSTLTAEVDALTTGALTSTGALALSSKIMTLASGIASGGQV